MNLFDSILYKFLNNWVCLLYLRINGYFEKSGSLKQCNSFFCGETSFKEL